MKIIFVGDLNEYTRSFQRFEVLKSLGHEVIGISHVPIPWKPQKDFNLIEAISWRLKIPVDSSHANKKIKDAVIKNKADVVWIEKGNTILPSTLRYIKTHSPDTKLMSVSEDDMYPPHNRSFYYTRGLRWYDAVFTTKVYNLAELKTFGAKRTELFLDAYSEKIHRPYELSEEERTRFSCDVGFMGSFEGDRAERMLFLAEHGVKVAIWGNDWGPWVRKHPNLDIKNQHLFVEEYPKAICATKINLCFLRKINRDEVTSRSVEIPACGGFLLGERTKRHLEFFVEGKEAEFFDSNEEMLKKVRYYLAHEDERKRIALAGRERCMKSGYSMNAQLAGMLAKIFD